MKFTLLNSLFLLLLSSAAFAQANGDYRSVASGDWASASTWETYNSGTSTWGPAGAAPVAGPAIEIRSPNTVSILVTTTIANVTVDLGGTLTVSGTFTATLNSGGLGKDIDNSGTVNIQGNAVLSGAGTLKNEVGAVVNVALSGTLGVTTSNSGTINFSQTSGVQGTLTNNSVITWQNNVYLLSGGTIINNDSISVRSASASPVQLFTNATGTLTNNSGAVIYQNDPAGSLVEASAITFTNNGTIHGFGTFDFAGTAAGSNGTIKPGNGTSSQLTVSPATLAGTPTLQLNLSPGGGTPTAGSTYDQLLLSGSGAVPLSATTLTVTDAASGDAVNTVYTLISSPAGSISSVPGTVNLPSTLGNLTNTGTSITVTRLTVLPLNWGTFTVTAGSGQAHLSWTTLQENNTARFTIERSADGTNFTAIGTVAAKGNTSTVSSYSYNDANPSLQGFNYYRLAEADLDGKVNYSLIRVISFGKSNAVIVQTSPNPVKDLLNIVVQDDNITILLSDMSGRALKTLRLSQGFHQTSIGDLTSGVYQLTIYKGSNKIDSRQILKF